MRSKHYHRADVILGKCETTPALVESIQFHGIENTKNDALVKEIAPIYKSANVAELIHNCNLAAKHMQVDHFILLVSNSCGAGSLCFNPRAIPLRKDFTALLVR